MDKCRGSSGSSTVVLNSPMGKSRDQLVTEASKCEIKESQQYAGTLFQVKLARNSRGFWVSLRSSAAKISSLMRTETHS